MEGYNTTCDVKDEHRYVVESVLEVKSNLIAWQAVIDKLK
jgi:hypothetical protein